MDDLLKLAERCESETPSWTLDQDIGAELGFPFPAPALTFSIDAALKLLPPAEAGYSAAFWRLGNDGEGGDPSDFKAEVLLCSQLASRRSTAVSATPALALCAAALRARSSVTEKEG